MNASVSSLDVVGGATVVGGEAEGDMGLVRLVRRGLPVGTVEFVLDSGRLTLAELDRIVLPRKTLANRRKLGRSRRSNPTVSFGLPACWLKQRKPSEAGRRSAFGCGARQTFSGAKARCRCSIRTKALARWKRFSGG